MTAIFEDNFELYGGLEARLIEGVWAANTNVIIEIPPFETEGRYWARAAPTTICGLSTPQHRTTSASSLFSGSRSFQTEPCTTPLRSETQVTPTFFVCFVTSIGHIEVRNSSDVVVASTSTPVITASTTFKMQVQAVFDAAAGTVEVRVGTLEAGAPATVISATGLALPGTAAQTGCGKNTSGSTVNVWHKCFASYSLSGTYNSNFPAISGVLTLMIDEDTAEAGLTKVPRAMFGDGTLYVPGDQSALELRRRNHCLRLGIVRLHARNLRPLRHTAHRHGLRNDTWEVADTDSNRSYRLRLNGASEEGGGLQFEYSTDGTLGTGQLFTTLSGHLHRVTCTTSPLYDLRDRTTYSSTAYSKAPQSPMWPPTTQPPQDLLPELK